MTSTNTADELSQRVRNLLKEIDTSLDEPPVEPPKLPKLILGLDEAQDQVKQGLRSFQSNHSITTSIATPRSIEDLTTDEKYGSFMPQSHASRSPDSAGHQGQLIEIEDLEEDQINPKEMLQNDQLMAHAIDESNNTTSQLKSEDAEAPSFPSEAYGTRTEEKSPDRTQSTLYQKSRDMTKASSKNVSFVAEAEVEKKFVQESKVSTIESETDYSRKTETNSVRVAEVDDTIDSIKIKEASMKSNYSELKSINVKDDQSTLINDSVASNNTSFQVSWFPKNMKEFKKLTREQKKEMIQALKRAAKKKKQRMEDSIASSTCGESVASSTQMHDIFDKWHKPEEPENPVVEAVHAPLQPVQATIQPVQGRGHYLS